MTKNILLTLNLLFLSSLIIAQTTLTGKVTDAESGEELIGANVQVYRNGVFIIGDATDIDGNFNLRVDPGTYDVDFAYTGYPSQKVEGVVAVANQATKVDVQMQVGTGEVLDEIVVTGYKVPLIKQDQTSTGGTITFGRNRNRSYGSTTRRKPRKRKRRKKNQNTTVGGTVTSEQIRNLPTRNINTVAAQTAGSSSADEGSAVTIKGSRSNATDYYIDGVRVTGNLLPESEIEQVQVIQGGLSAAYSHPDEVKENPNQQSPPFPFKETPPKKKKEEKEIPVYNEEYETIVENEFLAAMKTPLSTFSIDVDNASYSNVRRYLNNHQMPPKNAVRIEEFINYFDYDYPQPSDVDPFSINTEISDCPWNPDHKLVHIGLQGCDLPKENMPPSNLVFLLDVSGSMSSSNKLPLVKESFKLLVQQLREEDKVSIVVYAGSSGLVLPPTSGSDKNKIIGALDQLHAGGSTAGAAGIQLAYKTAQEAFIKDGNNRVILATDGDFNVGTSSDSALIKLIEEKRETGIALTILGFGMGNYKDGKMEKIADNGNGNYAYIDNFQEAKKIFVKEIGGTLHTIAKDVKLQLEFNPVHVKEYRLIGYENRKLLDEDFNNDQKDAGDLGAGHTVTALYEIVPTNSTKTLASTTDDLKYQTRSINTMAQSTPDWMTIKLRYKEPDKNKSKLLEVTTTDEGITLDQTSENFKWSAAVASFGMVLRDSQYKGNADLDTVLDLAKKAIGKDPNGYRKEFLGLVKKAKKSMPR